MNSSADPASLQNLNPIVLPDAVGILPLAPGWYFVLAALVLLGVWAGWRGILNWQANRYRRTALQEFKLIRAEEPGALPALLKRVAMVACSRGEAAPLTGAPWHEFLDRTDPDVQLGSRYGALLDRISYGNAGSISTAETTALLDACHHWLKHHRAGHYA